MEKKVLKKRIIAVLITSFIILNICMLSMQFVNAEETTVNADSVLEGILEKYINYNLNDEDKGTLVQYHLRSGIIYKEESKVYPIKENETNIQIGKIDGKYPHDVKVIVNDTEASNGNTDKYANTDTGYNPETGILTIKIHNQDENGKMISEKIPNGDSRDDYLIVCYYDTYTESPVERELSLKISSKTTVFGEENNEVYGEGDLKHTVTENIGELTSVKNETEEIYNGYIKSNIINGTQYNTEYKEVEEINISKKEAHEKIQLIQENTFVRTNGEEIVKDLGNENQLIYKSTKFEKQNLAQILGEEGSVEILDENENLLATIDKNTQFAEDGSFTITYENDVKSIKMKTSNIINEGSLYIENVKEIKNTLKNIENVKIKTLTHMIGLNEEEVTRKTEENVEETQKIETESYRKTNENLVEIKEAKNDVKMVVNSTEWTNKQQNDVTFDITLNTDSIKKNLFKDTTLKIQLPSQVEKIILGNSSIIYGNGLSLQEPYIETDENGNSSIIANLAGTQTQYDESNLGLMTNIKISATIILKKDIENVSDKLTLLYTNNYSLNGNIEEGVIETPLTIKSYNAEENPLEEIVQNINSFTQPQSQDVIDSLKMEVIPVKGDMTLNDGDIVYEGEYIKYNIKITNISNTAIDGVKVIGQIPEGTTYGELYAEHDRYAGEYKYNFDNSMKEKQIVIGKIEPGETYETFYEVQVNDINGGEKEIISNIVAYVNDTEAKNYEISNTVKNAEVKVFLKSFMDNSIDRWDYEINLQSDRNEEITVELQLPKEYEINSVWKTEGKIEYQYNEEKNIVTIVVKPGRYFVGGFIYNSSIDKTSNDYVAELKATAKAIYNGIEYKSNENRLQYHYFDTKVQMSSENEGKEVRYGEEIEYQVAVSIEGQKNIEKLDRPLVSVNLLDYLPSDLEAVSITYDNWEEIFDEISVEEGNIVQVPTGEYTKTQITENISSGTKDEEGNKMANVDLLLHIPYGETAYITIRTTAGLVYEKTIIENSVTIANSQTDSKTSNKITHIILPLNYEEPIDPDNPNPDNPDPDNPNPDDPDNPNPDNPDSERYDIKGVAWLDENEDGARQSNEQLLNGITVMLIDMQNSSVIKEKTKTDNSGSYGFYDLEKSQYIVIFQYDTNSYYVTEYQNSGISETLNSDAMAQTIILNGQEIEVGVTDIIPLDKSVVSNIDIGLVENRIFDLKLEKYISAVTVQTNKKTVSYSYNNQKLVKVDIHAKELEGAKVNVEYKIVVTNEGNLLAKVGSVKDYLPEGFVLDNNMKKMWIEENDGSVINNSLANDNLKQGESVTLTLTATKTMTADSTGVFINKAEIAEASNTKQIADIDSIPGNHIETEDDFSKAEIIISVGTGGVILSISIFFVTVVIIGVGAFFIKKYGIAKKVKTTFIVLFTLGIILSVNIAKVSAAAADAPEGIPGNENFTWCIVYPGPNQNIYCPHGEGEPYNNEHGSTHFTGSDAKEAKCVEYTASAAGFDVGDTEAREVQYEYVGTVNPVAGSDTTYAVWNGSDWVAVSYIPSDILSIPYAYLTVGIKVIDNNYILGPLKIDTNIYNGGYTFEVRGTDGDLINSTTCDASGNNMAVTGEMEFYLKVSASNVSKGISAITAKVANVTKTTVTSYETANIQYTPGERQDIETLYVLPYNMQPANNTYGETKVTWTNINNILDIVKQDADDPNVVLSDVQIRVQNPSIGYDKTFTTDENGRIHIDNLYRGVYTITEVSNDHYGYADLEYGYTTMYTGMVKEYILKNVKDTGNVQVIKKDTHNNNIVLPGVSFKIKNEYGQYIIAVDTAGGVQKKVTGSIHLGNLQTTGNINDATEFVTDNHGMIRIYNLLTGRYQVIETSVGNNFGYEVGDAYVNWTSNVGSGSGNNAMIEVNRKTSQDTGTNAGTQDSLFDSVTIRNKREYIKIRGFAWEERTDGKTSTKDYTWNDRTEDKKLANITVRLKNSSGRTMAEAITNANGEYVFGNYDENAKAIKLKIDDLVGAYIEFEYNGMNYQSIKVNAQFTKNMVASPDGVNTIVKYTGNKNVATDGALRSDFNNKYATISKGISSDTSGKKTYNIKYQYDAKNHQSQVIWGTNLKYGYTGQKYPISGVDAQYTLTAVTAKSGTNVLCTSLNPETIRKESVAEIGGLNLGVEERQRPDVFLVEDMEKLEVRFNNYTHTYQYAQRFENPQNYAGGDISNPSIRFANKYLENSYTRELYPSDIIYNKQAGNAGKLKVFVTYKLKLTNESSSLFTNIKTLANYYDARYENIVIKDDTGKTVQYQVDNTYNQNGLKKMNIQANYKIESGKTREMTITYQLNNDAVNSILKGQITLESITEVTSYSSYSDKNYSVPYAGIDIDSAPDTVNPNNIKGTIEDDTDKAPSVILKLKNNRVVQGKVWEDSAIEKLLKGTGYNKERKGDGTYSSTENVVNNVKVELLDGSSYQLANLYQLNGTKEEVVKATTNTNKKGEYSFTGVIPSKYILRYTYGDNSVIVDANGNILENVDIDYYKSTIYRGGNKTATQAMTDYWYRGETGKDATRLSDAKDTLGIKENGTIINNIVRERTTEEEITYESAVASRELEQVSADTRIFDIKLDYDVGLNNSSKYGADLKYIFDNIDFGIIERPKQPLILDKQIANVQIMLANGNDLINGDPRRQYLPGVRVLDDDVYIEIDNEMIQGSTLRITYEIIVDNRNCEIDYNNEDYYIYGIVPQNNANWKIATVTDMYDYLPEDLEWQPKENNNDWERIHIDSSMKGKLLTNKVYEDVKDLQNIIHLKNNSKYAQMKPGSIYSDTIIASKQLSTSTDDLTYENDVEIIKLNGRKVDNATPGNYDPITNQSYDPKTEENIGDERDNDRVELTITPPTGENKPYWMYGIIGISTLIIFGAGVIIIKKKVL